VNIAGGGPRFGVDVPAGIDVQLAGLLHLHRAANAKLSLARGDQIYVGVLQQNIGRLCAVGLLDPQADRAVVDLQFRQAFVGLPQWGKGLPVPFAIDGPHQIDATAANAHFFDVDLLLLFQEFAVDNQHDFRHHRNRAIVASGPNFHVVDKYPAATQPVEPCASLRDANVPAGGHFGEFLQDGGAEQLIAFGP
jgi:hypothetical protein